MAIGAIHALFIWAGDILMLYALLGFTLPWFARRSDRELLRWSVFLLAMPTALYVAVLALWSLFGPESGGAIGSGPPAALLGIFERVGTGGIVDALKGNLLLLVGRWVDLIATMRFPKVPSNGSGDG